jgi:hypothetical protein
MATQNQYDELTTEERELVDDALGELLRIATERSIPLVYSRAIGAGEALAVAIIASREHTGDEPGSTLTHAAYPFARDH